MRCPDPREVVGLRDDEGVSAMSTHLSVFTSGGDARRAPRLRRIAPLVAAAATMMLGATAVHAGCGDPRTMRMAPARAAIHLLAPTTAFRPGPAAQNIVGTWLVSHYGPDGSLDAQSYNQWHSDGTEWENIDFPIEGGNLCLGSWKAIDTDHVARNHYGWLYTSGTLSGHFNTTETVTVKHDGTYTGVNHTKVYDLDGNMLVEFDGSVSAVLLPP
jgi:hypothetical protein